MSLQSQLNGFNRELCSLYENSWKYNTFLVLALGCLVGFSIHGWLCIQSIVASDRTLCLTTFNLAIMFELMFAIFWLLPLILGTIINCIYTDEKESIVSHSLPRAIVYRNRLHTIEEHHESRGRSKSPRRESPRRESPRRDSPRRQTPVQSPLTQAPRSKFLRAAPPLSSSPRRLSV